MNTTKLNRVSHSITGACMAITALFAYLHSDKNLWMWFAVILVIDIVRAIIAKDRATNTETKYTEQTEKTVDYISMFVGIAIAARAWNNHHKSTGIWEPCQKWE